MSEVKFTAGPWKQQDRRRAQQGILITDETGKVGVCRVTDENQLPPQEAKALCQLNANLIAAAPDLLRALEWCEIMMDAATSFSGSSLVHSSHRSNWTAAREMARAALALAKGDTP